MRLGVDGYRKFYGAGVTERDYYWLTQQLVSLSNTLCKGRLVSALEGGYRIQGGVVSAFSRSVAAHVRALQEDNCQVGLKLPHPIFFSFLQVAASHDQSAGRHLEWKVGGHQNGLGGMLCPSLLQGEG